MYAFRNPKAEKRRWKEKYGSKPHHTDKKDHHRYAMKYHKKFRTSMFTKACILTGFFQLGYPLYQVYTSYQAHEKRPQADFDRYLVAQNLKQFAK